MWQNHWALIQSFQLCCCFYIILWLLWLSVLFCVGQKMSFVFKFYAPGPTVGNCAVFSVFLNYVWCLYSIILNTKMLLMCYTFLWTLMHDATRYGKLNDVLIMIWIFFVCGCVCSQLYSFTWFCVPSGTKPCFGVVSCGKAWETLS